MYSIIKRWAYKVLPYKLILKNEFLLRRVYALFFVGQKVFCVICNKHFSTFIKAQGDDTMCPRCGSLSRHRRLWHIIHNEVHIHKDDKLLDFSPSRIILKKLKEKYPNYIATDYQDNPLVDKRYDIQALPIPSGTFHLIICYHILEHIVDDIKAMKELYRVLREEGKLIIQTPFKEGDIYENKSVTTNDGRLLHFGQEDHVRVYSVSGLIERLQSAGFKARSIQFDEEKDNINGYKPKEFVIIATK